MAFTGKQASMRVNVTWQKLIFVTVVSAAAVLIMVRNTERKASGERLFTAGSMLHFIQYTMYIHSLHTVTCGRTFIYISMYPDVSLQCSQGFNPNCCEVLRHVGCCWLRFDHFKHEPTMSLCCMSQQGGQTPATFCTQQ